MNFGKYNKWAFVVNTSHFTSSYDISIVEDYAALCAYIIISSINMFIKIKTVNRC